MIKKLRAATAIGLLALTSTAAFVTPAVAREGATSIGNGIKCYYVLGVRVCYKGV